MMQKQRGFGVSAQARIHRKRPMLLLLEFWWCGAIFEISFARDVAQRKLDICQGKPSSSLQVLVRQHADS
jgi:hypothetical protein